MVVPDASLGVPSSSGPVEMFGSVSTTADPPVLSVWLSSVVGEVVVVSAVLTGLPSSSATGSASSAEVVVESSLAVVVVDRIV